MVETEGSRRLAGSTDILMGTDAASLSEGELVDHVLGLHRVRARLDAALCAAVGVFDGRMVWSADAARSAAGWLAARVDVGHRAAAGEVHLARDLRDCPAVSAAAGSGKLGRVKVRMLVAAQTPEVADLFAAHEAELVDTVAGLTVRDAAVYLRRWSEEARRVAGLPDDDPPPPEPDPPSSMQLSPTFGGRWDGLMDLRPEDGEILANALDAEIDALFHTGRFRGDDGLSPAQRRAIALVEILRRGMNPGETRGGPRPLVLALIDAAKLTGGTRSEDGGAADLAGLCDLARSGPVAPETIRRYACCGEVVPVVWGPGWEILDVGRAKRFATHGQWNALIIRDGGCAFPGCDAPLDRCEAHHLVPWDWTGPTDLDNLALLCRYHHHQVHEGGYTLIRRPDGTLQATRPDRQPLTPTARRRPPWRPSRQPPGQQPHRRTSRDDRPAEAPMPLLT